MIAIFAHIIVKPGTEEECIRLFREMTKESCKEAGCLQYVVHQSQENSRSFAIYEQYTDQAALDLHGASPHFQRYVKNGMNPLIESRTIELFVPLG
jgi:quinol monooxygenase YgiN